MNKRELAKLKKWTDTLTDEQQEKSMKGGCRDKELCLKRFARKEELNYGEKL